MGERWPNRLLRAVLALGSALALLSTTIPAAAIVVQRPIELRTGPEIPANGVLLFSQVNFDGLLLSDEGDDAVGGVFEALAVVGVFAYSTFRPDDDLALGAYTWETIPFIASGAVTALPAYEPAAHELDVELSLGEIWVGSGSVCCDPDPSTGEQTCVPTDKAQRYGLELTVRSPLSPEHAGQYLYRVSLLPELERTPPVDHFLRLSPSALWADLTRFTAGAWQTAALTPASEYCIELEAMSLIDDSLFTTRRCIADPGVELLTLPLSDDEHRQYFQFDGCASPDTGTDPSSDLGEGGCGCRVSSPKPGLPMAVALALALAAGSRRRSRRPFPSTTQPRN